MTSPELPHTNVRGLSYCPSHPVTDKAIEHFAESGENGFEPFPNVFLLMCGIENDSGHGGFLTNLTAHDVPTAPYECEGAQRCVS